MYCDVLFTFDVSRSYLCTSGSWATPTPFNFSSSPPTTHPNKRCMKSPLPLLPSTLLHRKAAAERGGERCMHVVSVVSLYDAWTLMRWARLLLDARLLIRAAIAHYTPKVMVGKISRLNSINSRLAHRRLHQCISFLCCELVHPARRSPLHLSSVHGCIMDDILWRVRERCCKESE